LKSSSSWSIVVLVAAVVSVFLFQRFGLGAVLGYLVAGAVIGPSGFALVADVGTIQTLGELGVVFLLFTVGLELPFERIRVMQARVFALGAGQVFVTALAVTGIAILFGVSTVTSVVIGGALALSSTAIVLRMLVDRGQLTSRFGRSCFAVLLVQDMMVGPFLVLAIALAPGGETIGQAVGEAVLKAVVAVMAILGIGRVVLRHVFQQVAASPWPSALSSPACCWPRPITAIRWRRTFSRSAGFCSGSSSCPSA
jgi:CPA2 family monovalent cation:H+ antiporter-2